TQLPKLENEARTSLMSDAATVMAVGVRAGDTVHASRLLLPAAIAYVMPLLTEFVTAWSREGDGPPPRLMLATAGLMTCEVTQLMPAMTPATVPDPEQSSTRTA